MQPKRRRGLIAIVVVVLVLALLVIGAIVAEQVARRVVVETVGDQMRTALALPADEPVEVRVAGWSVLLQVLVGRLDQVNVSADDVTFGELTGDARLGATGVPTSGEGTADRVVLAFSVDEADLSDLSANLSGLPITDVQIERPDIRFSAEFAVLSFTLPLSVSIEPEAVDGALTFTPTSIGLGEQTYTAAELRRTFGPLAESALQTRNFCIAQYVPRAIALDSIGLGDTALTFRFAGADVALTEQELGTTGSCPG